MTTKTDGISSGLVAVAWMTEEPRMLFFDHAEAASYCDEGDPIALSRLSDAEAIINDLQNLVIAENQRKQQLEEQVAKQSAALKLARQVLISVKETSSSTRLRRIVNEPLAAINEVLGEVK